MALPTVTDVLTMDFSFQGEPHVDVPAKSSIALNEMDFSFQGEPFVSNYTFASTGPAISKINTTSFSSISKVNTTAKASIKKINSIA